MAPEDKEDPSTEASSPPLAPTVSDQGAAVAEVEEQRPHHLLLRGKGDVILALRVLYVWHREGRRGLPPRKDLAALVGAAKTGDAAHRKAVLDLGDRLGVKLIEQTKSSAGFWRLTELGVRLGAQAPKILASLDAEIEPLSRSRLSDAAVIAELRRLGEELGVELIESPEPIEAAPGQYLTAAGETLAAASRRLLSAFDAEIADIEAARKRDLRLRSHIDVGCFNAQVKLYLARAFGPLVAREDFDYCIRFNRDMNIRTVNTRVILDDIGHDWTSTYTDRRGTDHGRHPGITGADPGLYRYRGFHYGVLPWIAGPAPYGVYAPATHDSRLYTSADRRFIHGRLYGWKLLVVAPRHSALHPAQLGEGGELTMAQVLAECEDKELPLLVAPPYNISRQMVDAALFQDGRIPLVSYVIENPDAYTRVEMASHGHGIAVVAADTLPPPRPDDPAYPWVVDAGGQALRGFHTLTWRPGKSSEVDKTDPGDYTGRYRSPTGVTKGAHRLLCEALRAEIANFIAGRHGPEAPIRARQGIEALEWIDPFLVAGGDGPGATEELSD